jgi:hypothetical protein
MNGIRSGRLWLHLAIVVALVVVIAVVAMSSQGGGTLLAADSVKGAVDALGGKVLGYALVIAAVGTVSMALVEFIKAVFDIRRIYHQWQVGVWVKDPKAYADLLFLAIGDSGRSDALFGQPIEKMMGQIQAAANTVLDAPDRYQELYGFLATSDVPDTTTPAREDRTISQAHAPRDRESRRRHERDSRDPARRATESVAAPGAAPNPDQMDAAKTRIRLGNLMSRKLDAFQIRTQYYWDRSNQLASVILSIAITDYALIVASGGKTTVPILALGLLGGAVAPFAKDLSSALSQFGQKR